MLTTHDVRMHMAEYPETTGIMPGIYGTNNYYEAYADRTSRLEALFFSYVICIAQKHAVISVSNRVLGEVIGCSGATISRWLKRLKAMGHIDIQYQTNTRTFSLTHKGRRVARDGHTPMMPDLISSGLSPSAKITSAKILKKVACSKKPGALQPGREYLAGSCFSGTKSLCKMISAAGKKPRNRATVFRHLKESKTKGVFYIHWSVDPQNGKKFRKIIPVIPGMIPSLDTRDVSGAMDMGYQKELDIKNKMNQALGIREQKPAPKFEGVDRVSLAKKNNNLIPGQSVDEATYLSAYERELFALAAEREAARKETMRRISAERVNGVQVQEATQERQERTVEDCDDPNTIARKKCMEAVEKCLGKLHSAPSTTHSGPRSIYQILHGDSPPE